MPHFLVEEIIRRNQEQVKLFAASRLERSKWLSEHPTRLGALKCMDGRVNLPVLTQTPFGIFRPWRNMGGIFDLGWWAFSQSLREWVKDAESEGREALLFVTYHWSEGDAHRGCRGFDYDLELSKKIIGRLHATIKKVFNGHRLYPILLGVETDTDALLVHGYNGAVLDLRQIQEPDEIEDRLAQFFPDMSITMRADLAAVLKGNARHILEVKQLNRPIVESEHKERVLAVGQGFDWIHQANMALIVGPFDPNLETPVATAAKLILQNKADGRINDERGVLLVCMIYHERWVGYKDLASERARVLADLSLKAIKRELGEQVEFFSPLVGVLNIETRQFEQIPYLPSVV